MRPTYGTVWVNPVCARAGPLWFGLQRAPLVGNTCLAAKWNLLKSVYIKSLFDDIRYLTRIKSTQLTGFGTEHPYLNYKNR